ncbi:MAG TPA: hypothetical protein VGL91_08885 [Acidobacteriota bacterium]
MAPRSIDYPLAIPKMAYLTGLERKFAILFNTLDVVVAVDVDVIGPFFKCGSTAL